MLDVEAWLDRPNPNPKGDGACVTGADRNGTCIGWCGSRWEADIVSSFVVVQSLSVVVSVVEASGELAGGTAANHEQAVPDQGPA